jgi:hypothetical protein
VAVDRVLHHHLAAFLHILAHSILGSQLAELHLCHATLANQYNHDNDEQQKPNAAAADPDRAAKNR